jgi:hypothetical protein
MLLALDYAERLKSGPKSVVIQVHGGGSLGPDRMQVVSGTP